MKNTKLAKDFSTRPLQIDTKQKVKELKSCQFDETYLAFLEHLISGKKIDENCEFIATGRQKGMRAARSQAVDNYVKRVSKSKTSQNAITVVTPKELVRIINENSKSILAKKTASFCLQQAKETWGNVFNTEMDRSEFYYAMSKILPNYEADPANPTSSLTIFLPQAKEVKKVSEWHFYEIDDITTHTPTPSNEQLANNLRLAMLLALLNQISTNQAAKNFQKITYNATSKLLYSLKPTQKNNGLILSDNIKKAFFSCYTSTVENYEKNKTKKQLENKENITSSNLELTIPFIPNITPPPPKMKAAILHSTQTQNRTLHDLETELDTHEANASQSICYFLAAFSGVIVNIKLPRDAAEPCENIIIAPTIFSDTVKQTQLFLNVDHTNMWHLKKTTIKGNKRATYKIIWNAKSTKIKRNLKRKQRSVMTMISKSIYNAEILAKGDCIATPSANTVVYPPYAPDPRYIKQFDAPIKTHPNAANQK